MSAFSILSGRLREPVKGDGVARSDLVRAVAFHEHNPGVPSVLSNNSPLTFGDVVGPEANTDFDHPLALLGLLGLEILRHSRPLS